MSIGTATTEQVHDSVLTDVYTSFVTYAYDIVSADISGTRYQVATAWDADSKMIIAVRANHGAWTVYTYDGSGGLPNLDCGTNIHKSAAVGIDSDGYIHVSYSHHNEPLHYRVSSNPLSSFDGALDAEESMLGTNETEVAYPTFFADPGGTLYFMFRDGGAASGDLFFYEYDTSTTSWSKATGTGTEGKLIDGKTSNVNPYWFGRPAFDGDFGSDGFMHLAWNWRGPGGVTGNHDVCYTKWDGTNWKQADGTSQTVSITEANAEEVDTIATSSGLANQNNIASDSQGRPHIAYVKDDGSGYSQIYHAIYDAGWTVTKVTDTENPSWSGGGYTETSELARPEIVVDRDDDTALIVYRDDRSDLGIGILLLMSEADDYSTWTEGRLIAGDDNHRIVNLWEPSVDPYRWQEDRVISLLYPA